MFRQSQDALEVGVFVEAQVVAFEVLDIDIAAQVAIEAGFVISTGGPPAAV